MHERFTGDRHAGSRSFDSFDEYLQVLNLHVVRGRLKPGQVGADVVHYDLLFVDVEVHDVLDPYVHVVGRPVDHLVIDTFQCNRFRCARSSVAVDMRSDVVNVVAPQFVQVGRVIPIGREPVVCGNFVIMVFGTRSFSDRYVQVNECLVGYCAVPVVCV